MHYVVTIDIAHLWILLVLGMVAFFTGLIEGLRSPQRTPRYISILMILVGSFAYLYAFSTMARLVSV